MSTLPEQPTRGAASGRSGSHWPTEAPGPQQSQPAPGKQLAPKHTSTRDQAPPDSSCGPVLQFLHHAWTGEPGKQLAPKHTPTRDQAPPDSSCGPVLQFLHRVWTGEWMSLLERDSRRRMERMLTKLTFCTSCVHQPEEALLPRASTLRLTLTLKPPLSRSFRLESKPSSQLAKAPKKTGSKEQVSKKTSRWPTGTLIFRKCRSKP